MGLFDSIKNMMGGEAEKVATAATLGNKMNQMAADPVATLANPSETLQTFAEVAKNADNKYLQNGMEAATQGAITTAKTAVEDAVVSLPGGDAINQAVDVVADRASKGMKAVVDVLKDSGVANEIADIARQFGKTFDSIKGGTDGIRQAAAANHENKSSPALSDGQSAGQGMKMG